MQQQIRVFQPLDLQTLARTEEELRKGCSHARTGTTNLEK